MGVYPKRFTTYAMSASSSAAAATAAALPDEPVLEVYDGGWLYWSSVGNLDVLTSLTRLTINVEGVECDDIFWRSIRDVTSLRGLHIRELDMAYFGGIVELATCRALTCLLTDCSEDFPDFEMKVRLLQTTILACVACHTSQTALDSKAHGALVRQGS
jgi:hypothetical protein